MKATIAIVSFGVIVLAAGPSFGQSPVERGTKVYAAQKCSLCHSVAGKGNAKGPLDGVGTKLKPEEIRAWILTPAKMAVASKAERKPAMKAYPSLPKDDLDALVAYLSGLKTK
jgi:mono/diheme cytochrome c family protein